ncbi:hypothetical protein D3C79_746320 [compost metagenome]
MLQRATEFARSKPEHRFQLGRPIVFAADQIDVEQTNIASFLRQVQTIAGRTQLGFHCPAFRHVAHRGTHASATPLQAGQMGQANFHAEQAAVLTDATQVIQIGPHLASAFTGNKPVA